MADTFTPHYNFTLPSVGGDPNTWGNLLNANWSSVDSDLYAVSQVANAALPLAGGTMTGALSAPTIYSVTNLVVGPVGAGPATLFTPNATMATWNSSTSNWNTAGTIWNAENFNPALYAELNTPVTFNGLLVDGALDTLANEGGLHVRWNENGNGEGDLVVNKDLGVGGFRIRQVELNGTTQDWIWSLDQNGNVSAPGNGIYGGTVQGATVESTGNVYAGGTAAYMDSTGNIRGSTWPTDLNTHINSTFETIASAAATYVPLGQTYMHTDGAHLYNSSWDGTSHLDFYVDGNLIGYVASDEKLKENIKDSDVDAVERVDALRFVEFNYKPEIMWLNGRKVDNGVIAQQAVEVNPNYADTRSDGNMGLNTEYMLFDALKAIQQLSARVHALESALGI
jgi:hypothetical protein